MAVLVSKINLLGDVIAFLPTLKAIRDNFKDKEIVVLTTPVGKSVIENALPNIKILTIPRGSVSDYKFPFHFASHWLRLQKYRFEISFFSYDEPSISYLLASMLSIPSRIGFRSNIAKFQKLLTKELDVSPLRNVVDLNFDLARYAASDPLLQPEKVKLTYSEPDISSVRKKLSDNQITANDKYAIIHAGAKYPYKTWPIQKFIAIADHLESINIKSVFIGTSQNEFPEKSRTFTAASIGELAYIIDNAAVFIGNNSGPMNIASTMGTPSVVLCGPSPVNWDIFWPDTPHKTIYGKLTCVPCESLGKVPKTCRYMVFPSPCLDNIDVDEVIYSIKELIG